LIVELVFIEVRAIQGGHFHPILPDLGQLGVVALIHVLVNYQVPRPSNMASLLLCKTPYSRRGGPLTLGHRPEGSQAPIALLRSFVEEVQVDIHRVSSHSF
jgi:hypothetical protein